MARQFQASGLPWRSRALSLVVILSAALVGGAAAQRVITLDPEPLDTRGPIPYFITDGQGVPGWQPLDAELARLAFDAWSRESGNRLQFVEIATESEALIRLVWVSAEQGLFGQTRHIRINGRPGAFVYVMPDVSQLGPELAQRAGEDRLLRDTIVYLTCVHELGHAVGMGHTNQFADIMYSFAYGGDLTEYFLRYRRQLDSRDDIRLASGLSAADVGALRAIYSPEGP